MVAVDDVASVSEAAEDVKDEHDDEDELLFDELLLLLLVDERNSEGSSANNGYTRSMILYLRAKSLARWYVILLSVINKEGKHDGLCIQLRKSTLTKRL